MPKSGRVYADNPQNRALGRVGKPFGSAPVTTGSRGKPYGGEDGGGKGNSGKKTGKDLGPNPSATGYRTGDTQRMKGEVLSVEEVNRRLQALGVPLWRLEQKGANNDDEDEEEEEEYEDGTPYRKDFPVSRCVRAAIQRGFIELKGEDKKELNQIVAKIKIGISQG